MFDLKEFRRVNKLTQQKAAEYFECNQAFISQIEKGARPIPARFLEKVESDPNIIAPKENVSTGYMSLETAVRESTQLINDSNLVEKNYGAYVPVKLVTTRARAGFAGAYYADEYLEDMPTVMIEADKEYRGKYLAFEVDGDSMEPEYQKGDVVICREVKRDLWQYRLHYKDWDFVIAHGTKGIMLKEIVDHDVDTGIITCHSLNETDHPDFELNLREVAYLYNVVEHRVHGKNRRRYRR